MMKNMKNNNLNQYLSFIGKNGGKKTLKKYGKKYCLELPKKADGKRMKKKKAMDKWYWLTDRLGDSMEVFRSHVLVIPS